MFQVWDYECVCGNVWEEVVKGADRDAQACPVCGEIASRLPAAPLGLVPSQERTSALLQQRSREHMAWCKKTGTHPNDTGDSSNSYNADLAYRNKIRAKNTSRETINQFRNAHKGYEPGRHLVDSSKP